MSSRGGQFESLGDFFYLLAFIDFVIKVFCYLAYSRPTEDWESWTTRMEYGEFRSPAIRARMERDPAFRARMEALLRTSAFRRKVAEVESTNARLRSAIQDVDYYEGKANEAAAGVDAARESNDDEAEASTRLLASSRDELARVTARVAELTAKHEAEKAALTQLVLAVAVHPLTLREAVARATAAAAAAAREGGGEGVRSRGTAVVAVEGEASRRPAARGTGAGGAAVELVEISGPADMEEGRSL